ncbi:hypothetical protein VTL71DRAFT_4740 [Oculimacula yallundae]|uniref:2EXR domain-containing protein n=1 Tax=Oculimacula yallundae TaxID=86028 RepID=A0ABR4C4I1_9HELO
MARTPSLLTLVFEHVQLRLATAKEKKAKIDIRKIFARNTHVSETTKSSPLTTQSEGDSLTRICTAISDVSTNDFIEDIGQTFDDPNGSRAVSETVLPIFSKFPELPFELRRIIWSHAATPEHVRFLPVGVTLRGADEEMGIYFTFSISPRQIELPEGHTNNDEFNIAMLSACSESRDVYLEHHKNILPAGFQSIIRYDPDRTIIHIQNFEDLQRCQEFADAVRAGWRRQKWLREIKSLCVPIFSFMLEEEESQALWGEDKHGAMMSVFENLDHWRGLVHPGDLTAGREVAQRQQMEIMAHVVQGELQIYKDESNPNYKIPNIEIYEIIHPAGVKVIKEFETIEDVYGIEETDGLGGLGEYERLEDFDEYDNYERLEELHEYDGNHGLDKLDE